MKGLKRLSQLRAHTHLNVSIQLNLSHIFLELWRKQYRHGNNLNTSSIGISLCEKKRMACHGQKPTMSLYLHITTQSITQFQSTNNSCKHMKQSLCSQWSQIPGHIKQEARTLAATACLKWSCSQTYYVVVSACSHTIFIFYSEGSITSINLDTFFILWSMGHHNPYAPGTF